VRLWMGLGFGLGDRRRWERVAAAAAMARAAGGRRFGDLRLPSGEAGRRPCGSVTVRSVAPAVGPVWHLRNQGFRRVIIFLF
jgi:hypothetical protein